MPRLDWLHWPLSLDFPFTRTLPRSSISSVSRSYLISSAEIVRILFFMVTIFWIRDLANNNSAFDLKRSAAEVWLIGSDLEHLANNNSAPAQVWVLETLPPRRERRGARAPESERAGAEGEVERSARAVIAIRSGRLSACTWLPEALHQSAHPSPLSAATH